MDIEDPVPGDAACGCHAGTVAEPQHFSRRRLMRAGIAGTTLGALSGCGAMAAGSPAARAESLLAVPTTPAAAVRRLLAGNRNFVGGTLKSVDTDLAEVRNKTALNGQRPWAAVLSCADSRVPVEWAFDVVIGQVFVCRVAGNIATPENIASLEYGVRVLGALAILVLGHGSCGAVDAARGLTGGETTENTQISSLYSYIAPGIVGAKSLDQAIMTNARFQASVLGTSSRLFADRIAAGRLLIVPGYYDLATGQVTLLRG